MYYCELIPRRYCVYINMLYYIYCKTATRVFVIPITHIKFSRAPEKVGGVEGGNLSPLLIVFEHTFNAKS